MSQMPMTCVYVQYEENIESYLLNADLTRMGWTKQIMEAPDGDRTAFRLRNYRDHCRIARISDP